LKKLEKNIKKFLKENQTKLIVILILKNFWTSNKPINGLRHFILLNKTKEKGNLIFLMVSVLDSEIYLKITYEELINSGNWNNGWSDLPKFESITEEYVDYKSSKKVEGIDGIFVNDDSLFNIS
tara:strand:- start:36 stop:407 length:372 start_codon:yes stop_codon:yes gene_type:complete